MSRAGRPTVATLRVRAGLVAWLGEQLSERDWAIMQTVNQLRLVTGEQLERLHFSELSERGRVVVRSRVLSRLVHWRVLMVTARRIGGARRGSGRLAYALDSAGQWLLRDREARDRVGARIRRPGVPSERRIRHVLAVSELYVRLYELSRRADFAVEEFLTEPACWWPNGLGGVLKPDAYARLVRGAISDHWWIEVDLATESTTTIRHKLVAYLDFYHRGQAGPHEVMPRVLVTVPDARRQDEVVRTLARLPDDPAALFAVVQYEDAVAHLRTVLFAATGTDNG